jgi:ferredoxin
MFSGKPTVNPLACAGCGYCLEVCPRGAIRWKDEEAPWKVPEWPSISSDYSHEWDQFPSRPQGLRRTPLEKSDLNELKKLLADLEKKANEIVRRIEHL